MPRRRCKVRFVRLCGHDSWHLGIHQWMGRIAIAPLAASPSGPRPRTPATALCPFSAIELHVQCALYVATLSGVLAGREPHQRLSMDTGHDAQHIPSQLDTSACCRVMNTVRRLRVHGRLTARRVVPVAPCFVLPRLPTHASLVATPREGGTVRDAEAVLPLRHVCISTSLTTLCFDDRIPVLEEPEFASEAWRRGPLVVEPVEVLTCSSMDRGTAAPSHGARRESARDEAIPPPMASRQDLGMHP